MLGGLARRTAYVEKRLTEGQTVLVVDSGDLFFDATAAEGDGERALKKAHLIARAYKYMGAAAINVGDMDLLQGLDFLQKEADRGLPLISANLLDLSYRKPIFSPHLIQEVSGVRIAFFGLLSPKLSPTIQSAVEGKVFVKDPIEAARETLLNIRDQADLVILLSDLGFKGDREVAKSVSGIHFVLGGHEGRSIRWPYQKRETFIVQSYKKGMFLGRLALTIENPGSPFRDRGKTDRLRQKIRNLNLRLQTLQRAQKRKPNETMTNMIQRVTQQKAELQLELQHSAKSLPRGNRFLWTLEPLNTTLPEDKEVRGWVKAAGIERD